MVCIFCDLIKEEQVLYETDNFRVVFDIDPIQTGHLLVMTKAHVMSVTELSRPLLHELITLEAFLVKLLEETLPLDGVTRASNDKGLMDQGTHFHTHIIPRRSGDGFWDGIDLPQEEWDLSAFLSALSLSPRD